MHTVVEAKEFLAAAKRVGMAERVAVIDIIAREPVVLLSVLSKGSDANFSAAQIQVMTKSTRSDRGP